MCLKANAPSDPYNLRIFPHIRPILSVRGLRVASHHSNPVQWNMVIAVRIENLEKAGARRFARPSGSVETLFNFRREYRCYIF